MSFAKKAERLYKQVYRTLRRWQALRAIPRRSDGRRWRSDLPLSAVTTLQEGTLKYSYRGIPMLRNPFEMALYPLLVWTAKPGAIIEIGSFRGASALWLADMMRTYGLDGEVVSIDIEPPSLPFERPDITFLRGDAHRLGDVLTPEFLARLKRPFLVIEDSTHLAATTRAVLDFFDPILRKDEYIVIEDALVTDLGVAHHYDGGPGVAIAAFLEKHRGRYAIDASFCDRYGHNFTGNPNGYLKRIA